MKKELIIFLFALLLFASGCIGIDKILDERSVGGIIMCGIDYRCGLNDKVCPESYGADCKISDPDCS